LKITKTKDEWKKQLSHEEFNVCREHGTEAPFSGKYYNNEEDGTYNCICCDAPLFEADTKFDSGTGWPSFTKPIVTDNVTEHRDDGYGMHRVEVRSKHGDSHLGHVFPDGPADQGGSRYCINSASLRFVHRDKMKADGYAEFINQVEDIYRTKIGIGMIHVPRQVAIVFHENRHT
jgi:peptide-methionine (R)-S-oxide reductase